MQTISIMQVKSHVDLTFQVTSDKCINMDGMSKA